MKALVLFSGGLDSTTCLFWAIQKFGEVETLSIDYGQRHYAEINCAIKILKAHKISNSILATDLLKKIGDSALVNDKLNVNDAHRGNKNLPASFVPGRNILFLTMAGMLAYKHDINNIVTGVNQQDYSGYPDCRQTFIDSMMSTLISGMEKTFYIHTPLINMTKVQIIKLGADLGIYDLVRTETHSCYNGVRGELHSWGYGCGDCDSCKIRRKAYADYEILYGQNQK